MSQTSPVLPPNPAVRARARRWGVGLLLVGLLGSASAQAADLLDVDYRPLAGKSEVNLEKTYGGKVLLVVNTASKCGYTPQYEALEALQKKYAARGFSVLGFLQRLQGPGTGQREGDPGVLHADLRREVPHVPEGAGHRAGGHAAVPAPDRRHQGRTGLELP